MEVISAVLAAVLGWSSHPLPTAQRAQGQGPPKTVEAELVAIPLKRRDAFATAKKLRAFLANEPNVALFADEGTNTVFIRAGVDATRKARELIDRLDVKLEHHLITLKNDNAGQVAERLTALLSPGTPSGHSEALVTVLSNNTILILASAEEMRQLSQILPAFERTRVRFIRE